jgi:hypothetical protein
LPPAIGLFAQFDGLHGGYVGSATQRLSISVQRDELEIRAVNTGRL